MVDQQLVVVRSVCCSHGAVVYPHTTRGGANVEVMSVRTRMSIGISDGGYSSLFVLVLFSMGVRNLEGDDVDFTTLLCCSEKGRLDVGGTTVVQ